MADAVNVAKLKFVDAKGDKFTMSFNHVKANAADADVEDLVKQCITSRNLFKNKPTKFDSAVLVSTTTKEFDVTPD